MPRREYLGNWPCGEPGCRERARYVYDLKRDYTEAYQRYAAEPWRCTRHTRPDEVLSANNPIRRVTLTATKVRTGWYDRDLAAYERYMANPPERSYGWRPTKPDPKNEFLDGLYWTAEGERPGSGFTYGPGFKAFGRDFPEGTKLIVTAEVVLPDA